MSLGHRAGVTAALVLAAACAHADEPFTFVHEAQLFGHAPFGQASAQFGRSVSVSGDTVVVGEHLEDNAGGANAGSAYVFVRSGTTWSLQQKLLASDGAANDSFGSSVSLFGDTVVVGASGDDTAGGLDAGSAYVFVRSGTTWTQQQKLLASDGGSGDAFGISVSVVGDTVAVGAPFDDTPGGGDAGSAYVFVRSGTTWTQQQKLLASDAPTGNDSFGGAVSVSGDTVVVGASLDDTPSGADAGSAYVFVRSGTTWTQQQKLVASDGGNIDMFGNSVSVSGDTAVVGASFANTPAGLDAGSAYVFVRSGTTWTQQQKLLASDGASDDRFGHSVSVSGDTVVVGAPLDNTPDGMDAGSAYVFIRSGTTWTQQQKLLAPDGTLSDQFGGAVSVSGDTAVVGAPFDDTSGGVDAGSAHVFRELEADLATTKTDGQTTAVPGLPLAYTIVASNSGPSNAPGVTVTDTFPAALTGVTWTCVAAGGATCTAGGAGNINDTVNLPAGATTTYTATGTVAAGATGMLSNTATVTPPGGVTDPDPANNSATDTDVLTPQADLGITKTDGQTAAVPGLPLIYTIVAGNSGPSNAPGVTVTDTFPAALTGVTWTCVAAGGATCTAGGAGNINDTVNLPAGATTTYTATGTVAATATGTLSNTATVTPPGGVADPDPANNSATDTDILTPQADVGVTKTDGQTTAVPGQPLTYTIVASNSGPSNAPGVTVTDTFPAALTGVTWTCVAAGGATCTAGGAGDIGDTPDLPVGGTATYTATGTVAAGATGTLSNTATVTPPGGVADPDPANNSATDTDTLTPQADLGVTKTDGQTTAVPGQPLTYTIVGSNSGPSNAPGATVTDTFPLALTGVTWTCVAVGGASCTAGGSGSINDTANLPVGGATTYTVLGTVAAGATGTLSNTANVTAPSGVTDPNPANDSATDIDTLTPETDLSITKTDSADPVSPGDPLTYLLTITNAGPSDATLVAVTDTLPTSVTFVSSFPGPPECTLAGVTLSCDLGTLIAAGGTTVTINVTVNPSASGILVNTGAVSGNETDPNPRNNAASAATAVGRRDGELAHGTDVVYDLAALPGPLPDEDVFRINQKPYSSYEVMVDSTSGDIGAGSGPALERIAPDGSTVLQGSNPIGTGSSRSLRWSNTTSTEVEGETIRVRSTGCGTDCGPDDIYRIRAYETTYSVPRFNNSGTQITVLVLQNPMNYPISGQVYFRSTSAALVAVEAFSLNPRQTLVLNTATVPGVNGVSGAITVAHDGRYGDLSGKTVALEPTTGFSFDSALVPRQK